MPVPPPITSSAERLAEAVLAQAREEAARIRKAAEAEAGRVIAEAEAEAAERTEAAARGQAAEALRVHVSGQALARLDARRELLDAREQRLERVFERTLQTVESLRAHPEYASVLERLAREAIAALGGRSFVLEVAPEDLSRAAEVAAAIATGDLAIEPQVRAGLGGGCVVRAKDRRAFCDNTFTAVLSRNKPRLRALVAELLWGVSAETIGDLGGASRE